MAVSIPEAWRARAGRSIEWIGDEPARRPVRRLQTLRFRGQPLHHRVPLLRQAAAPPRAEDPAREHLLARVEGAALEARTRRAPAPRRAHACEHPHALAPFT